MNLKMYDEALLKVKLRLGYLTKEQIKLHKLKVLSEELLVN
jgi:hypothetical protein